MKRLMNQEEKDLQLAQNRILLGLYNSACFCHNTCNLSTDQIKELVRDISSNVDKVFDEFEANPILFSKYRTGETWENSVTHNGYAPSTRNSLRYSTMDKVRRKVLGG